MKKYKILFIITFILFIISLYLNINLIIKINKKNNHPTKYTLTYTSTYTSSSDDTTYFYIEVNTKQDIILESCQFSILSNNLPYPSDGFMVREPTYWARYNSQEIEKRTTIQIAFDKTTNEIDTPIMLMFKGKTLQLGIPVEFEI